jgi:hypothetical protein
MLTMPPDALKRLTSEIRANLPEDSVPNIAQIEKLKLCERIILFVLIMGS